MGKGRWSAANVAIWLGLIAFPCVCAAVQPPPPVKAVQPTPRARIKQPQRWALLIGVDEYVHVRSLQYCAADQEALSSQLVAAGYPQDQVFLLDDKATTVKLKPFKSNIETHLKLMLDLVEKGDTLIVSFSGHGVFIDGHSYLCPADAKLEDPQGTMVSLERVYDEVAASKAGVKLMIVDACRNDPRVPGERAVLDPNQSLRSFSETLEKPPEGVSLLASCSAGQFAREDSDLGHGVFMHFILKGLQGDAANDGVVSLMGLADYTSRETKKYVARKFVASQTPWFRGETDASVELCQVAQIAAKAQTPPPQGPPAKPQVAASRAATPAASPAPSQQQQFGNSNFQNSNNNNNRNDNNDNNRQHRGMFGGGFGGGRGGRGR